MPVVATALVLVLGVVVVLMLFKKQLPCLRGQRPHPRAPGGDMTRRMIDDADDEDMVVFSKVRLPGLADLAAHHCFSVNDNQLQLGQTLVTHLAAAAAGEGGAAVRVARHGAARFVASARAAARVRRDECTDCC